MATQQDVFIAIRNIKEAIEEKGGTVEQANINVSLPELAAGVRTIPTGGGGASYIIRAAELPNITLQLSKDGAVKESQSTGEQGGVVEFTVTEPGEYTIKALSGDAEQWQNTITVEDKGVYNCKSGKALNDYSWDDIKKAQAGDYLRAMFNAGDFKYLTSFMGQSSQTYTKCTLCDFDKKQNADGSGKKLAVFMIAQTSSTYKHRDASGTNGISWEGSLIRQNALKSGEDYYLYDNNVSSSTSGTYYKYDPQTKAFVSVELPGAFDSSTKYYTKNTLDADGAFIAGLPDEIKDLVEQVENETWGGAIGTDTNQADNTIIKTKDWLWLPSDSEIFGDDPDSRFVNYSKVGLEGKTFEAFKSYKENNFRFSNYRWLRSPYLRTAHYFCGWDNFGYVGNNAANTTNRVALCFCI